MSQPPPPPLYGGLETLPFAMLIDEAWRSSRRNARAILVPLSLALAPAALLTQVVMALWNLQMMGGSESLDFGSMCGTLLLGIGALLLIACVFLAIYGTMTVVAVRAVGGEAPAVGAAARFYLRPRVWATDLLAWLLIGCGMLACLLPGLLLMAVWALRLPVMAREGVHGWAALRRSRELLAHNPSRSLARHPLLKVALLLLLGTALGYAVSFVVQAPAMVLNQVLVFRQLAEGEAVDPQAVLRATLWLSIPAGVLGMLAQLPVRLYVDFATAHLYFDQQRRKEGSDLALAFDRLLAPTGERSAAAASGEGGVAPAPP